MTTHAAQTTVWDFRGGKEGGKWIAKALSQVEMTLNGLQIATTKDGFLQRKNDAAFPADMVSVMVTNAQDIEAVFMWHRSDDPSTSMFQLPFVIRANPLPQTVKINVERYDEWDPRSDAVAIGFPAGTTLLLHAVTLSRFSPYEKFLEGWKSFWSFDTFEAYSINFLWGPIVNFTPAGREEQWHSSPPTGWSGLRVFYAAFTAGCALFATYAWIYKRRSYDAHKHAWKGVLLLSAGLWLMLDIRMGSEILSYAYKDYISYISKPLGERTLRSRLDSYDVLEQSIPEIAKVGHVVLVTPWPMLGMARYLLFPSTLLIPGEPGSAEAALWLVYMDPAISIDTDRRLSKGGSPLSLPGSILLRFENNSFLFRTDAVSPAPSPAS